VMRYFAGGICESWYSPPLLEVALRVDPLALLLKVIVAPGTDAPVGSFTTPWMEVVAICAKLTAEQREKKRTSTDTLMRLIKSFLQRDNSLISPRKKGESVRVYLSLVAEQSNRKSILNPWISNVLQQGDFKSKLGAGARERESRPSLTWMHHKSGGGCRKCVPLTGAPANPLTGAPGC
jgi:hypothetical protein